MTKRLTSSGTFVLDPAVKCKCGNHATHWMEIHAVDRCTEAARTISSFLCGACLEKSIRSAEEVVLDGGDWCSSCGMDICTYSDLVVRCEPLKPLDA